jgi:glycosyltransferase involved in cell wall biosynthesis
MRLAVVNLTNGGMSGGYRKYLRIMLPLLRDDPRVTDLEVFVPEQVVNALDLPSFHLRAWPASDIIRKHSWLKAQLRAFAPDVVYIPTARYLDCGSIPTVIMVHNMEPLAVPLGGNSLRDSVKNLIRAYMAWGACRRASRVIAVSQYVKGFLADKWGINSRKIGLVHHGIESPPDPQQAVKPPVLDDQMVTRFIFTAGSIRPARGLEDAIRAMAFLRSYDSDLMLVIGGAADPGTQFYLRRMQRLADDLGVASRIIWAGQLISSEMSWCFHNCSVFLMTSRVEACPITLLEAMQHGCQIVSTSQPPMPEFLPNSILCYRPKNADELAEKVTLTLDASPEQQEARRLAVQSGVRDYRWTDTARMTLEQLVVAASVRRQ